MNIEKEFEKYDDEYLEFDRIENAPYDCPDVCAFILLNKLVPQYDDIVSAAEHDEIYLATPCEDFAKVATSKDILYLVRCGVRYDTETDSFSMFV